MRRARRCRGGLELLHGGRILAGGRNKVDFARQRLYGLIHADQILGGCHGPQGVAHFAERPLDGREAGAVFAGLPRLQDPTCNRAHLALERLDGLAWHGVGQRAPDFGEIGLHRGNRLFGSARPTDVFHTLRELLELLLQAG